MNTPRPTSKEAGKSPVISHESLFEELEPRVLYSAAPMAEPSPQPDVVAHEVVISSEVTSDFQSIDVFINEAAEEPSTETSDLATEATPTDSSPAVAITIDDVLVVAEEAKRRWIATGLDSDQIIAIENIQYRIADLSMTRVGVAEGNTITIDINAAGNDWFVDQTPGLDEEYTEVSSTRALANDSVARNGIDLLTVLMHEQGHILGLEDRFSSDQSNDLMNAYITEGERRVAEIAQASGYQAGILEGAHYMSALAPSDWVINEIHADPDATNGDANGDGTVSSTQDEFVELVYTGSAPVDIGGWTLSDAGSTRLTFPSAIINPGDAVVVFGGGSIGNGAGQINPADFGGAHLFTAGLSLNNSGDTVIFSDGVLSVSHTYDSSGADEADDNQAITRDPDLTGSFVKHQSLAGGLRYTPGFQTNGATPFGGNYNPAYSIDKTVTRITDAGSGNTTAVDEVGDVIHYQIVVTNTGDVDLTGVQVSDPLLAGAGGMMSAETESITDDDVLEVGEVWMYTGTYTVQPSDFSASSNGAVFSDVNIDFTEPAFPSVDGTALTGTVGYNVIDDATGSELNALNGDRDDFSITYASVGDNTRWIWDESNSGQIQAEHSFHGAMASNNSGDVISNTMTLVFADHLTVTDFSFDSSSLNTTGISWEYSVIEFLDTNGNPINTAPAIADYLNHTSINPGETTPGQSGGTSGPDLGLPVGVYILDSKDTVTGVGTNQVSSGSSGDNEAFTQFVDKRIGYSEVGIAAGTAIGGVRVTTYLEDVRGVNNNDTNFTSAITDFTFSGEVAANSAPTEISNTATAETNELGPISDQVSVSIEPLLILASPEPEETVPVTGPVPVVASPVQVENGAVIGNIQGIFRDFESDGFRVGFYLDIRKVEFQPSVVMEPYFAGGSTPGSTVEVVIRDEAGNVVATERVVSDRAGNWSTGIRGDLSSAGTYRVEISQSFAKWVGNGDHSPLTFDTSALVVVPSEVEVDDATEIVGQSMIANSATEALVKELVS